MHVEVVRTDALGDRSYLVHDGAVGVVIDPQRDFDRIERLARDRGVRISHVAETHLHNDYVTGGPELARRHGAVYLVGETEGLDYEATRLESGDRVDVGALSLTAVATPGHTDNHLAYIVDHDGEQAVFSGGSLLYGSVGRPDLVDPERTTELAKAQYRSARRLVDSVPDDAVLYPTHGFGSFCASDTAATTESSTIGEQRRTNRALTDTDEDHFVERLLANLTDYPSYYAHMAPLNRAGLAAPRLELPEPVDLETLRKRLADGEWVVDLRDRVAFAAKHVEGTVSFEYGDGTRFTTFLGVPDRHRRPGRRTGRSHRTVRGRIAHVVLSERGVGGAGRRIPARRRPDGVGRAPHRRVRERTHRRRDQHPATRVAHPDLRARGRAYLGPLWIRISGLDGRQPPRSRGLRRRAHRQ